jgi:hypothetical protein
MCPWTLRRVLPTRRSTNGTRPGIAGEGPCGPDSGDQDQWRFKKNLKLTVAEKKLIIAKVMHKAVLTLFQTHNYTFGGTFFRQKKWGPIGLHSTCCIARLVMIWWDRQLLNILRNCNIKLEEKMRYMDDICLWCHSICLGWR